MKCFLKNTLKWSKNKVLRCSTWPGPFLCAFLFSFLLPAALLCQEDNLFFVPVGKEKKWANGFYCPGYDPLLSSLLVPFLKKKREVGYLEAVIMPVDTLKDTTIYYYKGKQLAWSKITSGNIPAGIFNEIGVQLNDFIREPVNYQDIEQGLQKIAWYYANQGYPFATVWLDSLRLKDNFISASIYLEKNPYYIYDSLVVKSERKLISHKFLKKYLGITPGLPYQEKTTREVSKKIADLQFIDEIRSHDIEFTKNKVNLYTYLEKRPANQIDGIIGFQPNDKTSGKLVLTGKLDLLLQNSFHQGEEIALNWERLETYSQRLYSLFAYPYLFGTSFGIDASFELYRQDSSYLTLDARLGTRYQLRNNHFLKLAYRRKSSSLVLYPGANGQSYQDIQASLVEMAYLMERFDNRISPFQGFRLQWSFSAGSKEVGDRESYLHTEGVLSASAHVPIAGPFGIKIKNQTAWMWSEKLYKNELFRLGGLKTLRGHDENSMYASGFSILNVEPHLVIPGESTAFLFYDVGYQERPSLGHYLVDWPMGLGAGINLKTNSGIFSFVYALGRRLGNPIEFKVAKIHVGYVNRF